MAHPTAPEPWLRGPLLNVHPLVMPVFFSFQQVREDLERHLAGLRAGQVWEATDGGILGFHLKHLAGSVDRISTYLVGEDLNDGQLQALKDEASPEGDLADLLAQIGESLEKAEDRLRSIDPANVYERRFVGRLRLPTTVIGLIVHLAEHTQRHLGQAITVARILGRSS